MTNPKKIVLDCSTGETEEIELTAEEIAQREAENAALMAQLEQREAEAQAKAEAKASALAKLEALGLTEEEASALIS